jgi:prepilin peptidase CpaA
MTLVHAVILFLGIGLFAVVAYGDMKTRRIPNGLAIAVGILGLFRMILTGDPSAALYTLAASAGVFTATFLLFWRGFLGGGDVKLMAATALLVGYHDLFEFLFVMSVCGALVSLAVVAGYRLGLRRATVLPAEDHHKTSTRPTVPYGVAIAAAGILTLLLQSSVPG